MSETRGFEGKIPEEEKNIEIERKVKRLVLDILENYRLFNDPVAVRKRIEEVLNDSGIIFSDIYVKSDLERSDDHHYCTASIRGPRVGDSIDDYEWTVLVIVPDKYQPTEHHY